MKRRNFLATLLAAPWVNGAGLLPLTQAAEPTAEGGQAAEAGWRRFEITTRVALPEDAGAARLFLPLVQTAGGYQTALDLRWNGNGTAERVHDARYGAPMLRTTWGNRAEAKQIEVVQTVATREAA